MYMYVCMCVYECGFRVYVDLCIQLGIIISKNRPTDHKRTTNDRNVSKQRHQKVMNSRLNSSICCLDVAQVANMSASHIHIFCVYPV